ncbi:hypothetical protein ACQP1V_40640 [Microtetraspora malaysiensis]|uniref:hypothetical protein n=1 Tax=Microtetraspora malaysiensis TaxID=161358 RepID=UPI003D8BB452
MTRRISPAQVAGLVAVSILLPLSGVLALLQATLDSTLLWAFSVVAGFTVAVLAVVTGLSIAKRLAESAADATLPKGPAEPNGPAESRS